MFLQYGLVDYSEVFETGVFSETDIAQKGEDLYKQECRSCHGPDGARINFGTAEAPIFLGNLSDAPWRMVHLIRFGHLYVSAPDSDELGWSEQDVFDVLTLEGSVAARNHIGGTAPEQVKAAIKRARTRVE